MRTTVSVSMLTVLALVAAVSCGDEPVASRSTEGSASTTPTVSTPAPASPPGQSPRVDASVYVDSYVVGVDGLEVTFTGSPCTDHRVDVVAEDAASVTVLALLVSRSPPVDCAGDIRHLLTMTVPLDEALDDRVVVDGKTGRPAGLGEGWWTPVTIQAVRRADGRLGLDVVDESDGTGSCTGLFRARVGHDTPPTDELVTLVAESWRILPLPTSPVSCAGLPSVPDPEPTAPLARDLGTNRDLIISSE